MIETICALIGAVIGGVFSILVTIITLKYDRKQQYESNKQQFEMQMIERSNEKKESSYLSLIRLLSNLKNLEVELEPYSDEDGSVKISNVSIANLEKWISDIADYYEQNNAVMELYYPPQIKTELLKFRKEVYKINVQMPISLEKFPKVYEIIVFNAETIIELIRQDLHIPTQTLHKPTFTSNQGGNQ